MFKNLTTTCMVILGFLIILFMSGCPEPEQETEENPYLFTENFNDGEADNFFDDGTEKWSVADGMYQFTGQSDATWCYSFYNHLFTNFIYTIDILQTTGSNTSAYGFCFRSPGGDFQNTYFVSIASLGYWYLAKFVDGVESFISTGWATSANINTGIGATNTLEVICADNYITVKINGETEGTYLDTTFTSGFCGVSGYDSTVDLNVYTYDNFSVFIE